MFFSVYLPASADNQEFQEAKVFINKFETLTHKYDRKIIDMYSDEAKIIRHLEYKNGEVEKVVIPTDKYKKLLNFVKFFAKLKRYKNYYKDLEYKKEGENIRITGIRINSDDYKAPVSILVGKKEKGEWKILEEETNTTSVFLIKEVFLKF